MRLNTLEKRRWKIPSVPTFPFRLSASWLRLRPPITVHILRPTIQYMPIVGNLRRFDRLTVSVSDRLMM